VEVNGVQPYCLPWLAAGFADSRARAMR
jgi:hypothetical protein